MRFPFFVFVIAMMAAWTASGQASQDSARTTVKKPLKNTIRYNVTGPAIFGDHYLVLGYERVVNPHQSFTVMLGRASFPNIVSFEFDSLVLANSSNKGGRHFSVDYRFYLKNENRHDAPRGIYLAPYYAYNRFTKETNWTLNGDVPVSLSANYKFDIHTIGAEMGVQFILWRRLALDFILIGPGYSLYKLDVSAAGSTDPEVIDDLLDAVKDLIGERFPGLGDAIKDSDFDTSGGFRTWSVGFRYVINVGFRF